MTTSYDFELCILYLYHRCDEVTKFHLETLRRSNPTAFILPLTDAVPELLPGSVDVARYPSEFADSQKWRSIDLTLYRWFQNRSLNARHYIVVEYDCFCSVDLREHYAEVMAADVAGVDLFTKKQNPKWKWFQDDELHKLPAEDRPHAAGIVPFTCTMFSHAALTSVVTNVYREDIFCELRLGTIINKLGLTYKRLPITKRSRISYHEYPWRTSSPGLFHSIKSLNHNSDKPKEPSLPVTLVLDFLRSRSKDRDFLPFQLHAKMRALCGKPNAR